MARFAAKLLTAAAVIPLAAAAILAPTPAHADWRYEGHHGYYHRGPGVGAIVGGALLGLGIGTVLAAPYAAPPPVIYAPPPAYYPPPAYAYYPPPPPYYYGR